MIISHRFALVKCFFNFFEISFSELFFSFSISFALFSARLLYHNVSRLSRTFLSFFRSLPEDTSLRCRSPECLHILPYHLAIVNSFFKLFRHFLQRALVFLVRYAIYYASSPTHTLYICLKPLFLFYFYCE